MVTTARFEASVELTGHGLDRAGRVTIDASSEATVSDLAQEIRSRWSGAGDVLTVWDGRAYLPGDARLVDVQLTHGQRIEVHGQSASSVAPVLTTADAYRLLVEQGPQAGTAWPLTGAEPLLLHLDSGGYWTLAEEEGLALLRVSVDKGLVRCERAPGAADRYQLMADRAFDDESFIPGALIQIDEVVATRQDDDDHDSAEAGQTQRAPRSTLRILERLDHDEQRNSFGIVPFRIRPRSSSSELATATEYKLPSFPNEEVPRLDLTTVLVQLVPTFGIVLVMSLATTFRWYYLTIPFLQGGAMGFLQLRQHQKAASAFLRRKTDWMKETVESGGALRAQVEREVAAIESRNAPLSSLMDDADLRMGDLWRRSADDADFLIVNIGRGVYQSESQIQTPSGIPLNIRDRWRRSIESDSNAPDVPYEFPLVEKHLALVGGEQDVERLATNVLLDILLSHSPSRVTLVALLPAHSGRNFGWLPDWPHIAHKQSAWLDDRYRRGQRDVRGAVQQNREAGRQAAELKEHIVLLVDERSGAPLAELKAIADDSEGHVHIVWMGRGWGSVPDFISNWVEVDGSRAQIFDAKTLSTSGGAFKPAAAWVLLDDQPSTGRIAELSKNIRPLMDEVGSGRSASPIPDEVAIGGLIDLDDQNAIWSGSSAAELRLTFLVNERGPWDFDLVDAGPHILVGGMTGAGKSEFLRSLICSGIARYSPRELALLLVDFKGGASLGAFRDTPHCIGSVTNLSDVDVERLLAFLDEELRRREELFQPWNGEYKDFRAEPRNVPPPPRLLVVFDEFASFVSVSAKREEAIVRIAQKGRSLGVHLVLATQSPGTAVTQPIKDNVGARFALKTADTNSSERIIERSDAAGIAPAAKGRLFARLMDGKVYPFQSAHTRGFVFQQRTGSRNVTIRMGWASGKVSQEGLDSQRDLAVLLYAIRDRADAAGVAP